ncbi:Ig-like domain-containing protein, partial [Vibrio parahaemolyticus]
AAATETLTYTLTVAQTNPDAGKEVNGAALSASKGVVYTGSPAKPVELSNPNDLAVNYSSSDETVAIVDNGTGEITPLAEGVATITLELIGNATYQSSTLTYEVTVTAVSDALLAAFIDALPLLRKAGNKYGFSSKIHLAPGILHKTGAASLAVAAVKPIRGVWVGDMPEDVSTKEEAFAFKQQFGSDRYMPCWPRPLVIQDDGSTQVDWFAPSLAGLMAQVDRNGTGDTIVSETG